MPFFTKAVLPHLLHRIHRRVNVFTLFSEGFDYAGLSQMRQPRR